MARNDRIFDAGKLCIDDMKVGPAYPAGAHLDANFSVAPGLGRRAPAPGEAPPELQAPSHAFTLLRMGPYSRQNNAYRP
jgi:hypothetical protein